MASTYSNLKIQLMATGENSGTWGNVTNVNLGTAIEEAIAGSADVSFSGSNVSVTLTDTNASQTGRNMRLNLTGTGVSPTTALTVPDIEKVYIVNNALSYPCEVKNSTGANVTVPAGKSMILFSTGAGVVQTVTAATAEITGNVTGNLTGNVTGNVSGNVTGNVTGDVSGNVTGNVSGSINVASGSMNTTGWAIAQTGNNLTFAYGGTVKFSIDSNGNVTASNNVTAYGTPS